MKNIYYIIMDISYNIVKTQPGSQPDVQTKESDGILSNDKVDVAIKPKTDGNEVIVSCCSIVVMY
jgi:hypothetical protein